MRKWLYDRPWIWVVLFLALLIGASVATVIIAEVNKPEIVRPKEPRHHRSGPTSGLGAWRLTAVAPAPARADATA